MTSLLELFKSKELKPVHVEVEESAVNASSGVGAQHTRPLAVADIAQFGDGTWTRDEVNALCDVLTLNSNSMRQHMKERDAWQRTEPLNATERAAVMDLARMSLPERQVDDIDSVLASTAFLRYAMVRTIERAEKRRRHGVALPAAAAATSSTRRRGVDLESDQVGDAHHMQKSGQGSCAIPDQAGRGAVPAVVADSKQARMYAKLRRKMKGRGRPVKTDNVTVVHVGEMANHLAPLHLPIDTSVTPRTRLSAMVNAAAAATSAAATTANVKAAEEARGLMQNAENVGNDRKHSNESNSSVSGGARTRRSARRRSGGKRKRAKRAVDADVYSLNESEDSSADDDVLSVESATSVSKAAAAVNMALDAADDETEATIRVHSPHATELLRHEFDTLFKLENAEEEAALRSLEESLSRSMHVDTSRRRGHAIVLSGDESDEVREGEKRNAFTETRSTTSARSASRKKSFVSKLEASVEALGGGTQEAGGSGGDAFAFDTEVPTSVASTRTKSVTPKTSSGSGATRSAKKKSHAQRASSAKTKSEATVADRTQTGGSAAVDDDDDDDDDDESNREQYKVVGKRFVCTADGCDKSYSRCRDWRRHWQNTHAEGGATVSTSARRAQLSLASQSQSTESRPIEANAKAAVVAAEPVQLIGRRYHCRVDDCSRMFALHESWLEHWQKEHEATVPTSLELVATDAVAPHDSNELVEEVDGRFLCLVSGCFREFSQHKYWSLHMGVDHIGIGTDGVTLSIDTTNASVSTRARRSGRRPDTTSRSETTEVKSAKRETAQRSERATKSRARSTTTTTTTTTTMTTTTTTKSGATRTRAADTGRARASSDGEDDDEEEADTAGAALRRSRRSRKRARTDADLVASMLKTKKPRRTERATASTSRPVTVSTRATRRSRRTVPRTLRDSSFSDIDSDDDIDELLGSDADIRARSVESLSVSSATAATATASVSDDSDNVVGGAGAGTRGRRHGRGRGRGRPPRFGVAVRRVEAAPVYYALDAYRRGAERRLNERYYDDDDDGDGDDEADSGAATVDSAAKPGLVDGSYEAAHITADDVSRVMAEGANSDVDVIVSFWSSFSAALFGFRANVDWESVPPYVDEKDDDEAEDRSGSGGGGDGDRRSRSHGPRLTALSRDKSVAFVQKLLMGEVSAASPSSSAAETPSRAPSLLVSMLVRLVAQLSRVRREEEREERRGKGEFIGMPLSWPKSVTPSTWVPVLAHLIAHERRAFGDAVLAPLRDGVHGRVTELDSLANPLSDPARPWHSLSLAERVRLARCVMDWYVSDVFCAHALVDSQPCEYWRGPPPSEEVPAVSSAWPYTPGTRQVVPRAGEENLVEHFAAMPAVPMTPLFPPPRSRVGEEAVPLVVRRVLESKKKGLDELFGLDEK